MSRDVNYRSVRIFWPEGGEADGGFVMLEFHLRAGLTLTSVRYVLVDPMATGQSRHQGRGDT